MRGMEETRRELPSGNDVFTGAWDFCFRAGLGTAGSGEYGGGGSGGHSGAVRGGQQQHAVVGVGGDAVAGNEDAGEIERVGGSDPDGRGQRFQAPGCAQGFDRVGQGVLLAGQAADETAAADFAARFEAPAGHQDSYQLTVQLSRVVRVFDSTP